MTAPIAGAVFEDPATVIAAALPEPRKIAGGQQFSRRVADQPKNLVERGARGVPRPLESVGRRGDLPRSLGNL